MATQMRLLVMAARRLFGGVLVGHPCHKQEWRDTRSLASLDFAQNLAGLASRPVLRHPGRTQATLARAVTQSSDRPLRAIVVPSRQKPSPALEAEAAVDSLSTPSLLPPPAFCLLGGCVACGALPAPPSGFTYGLAAPFWE